MPIHNSRPEHPDSKRVELINNLRSSYRQVAMRQLLQEFPELAQVVRLDQINEAKAAVYGQAG